MKKDLIFEELERMREIMGVKNSFKKRVNISKMLNETTLLFEAGPGVKGDPESLFKALSGERIVDELITAEVKYIDNFEAALQRNLAGTEVGTMDDLIKSMEKHYADMGKLGDTLTPDQILGYIKRRPKLAQSFEEAILKSTEELFQKRVNDYGVKEILRAADMPYIYDDIKELSNQAINSTTRESVQDLVNAQRKVLNDLKNSGKLNDNQKIGISELEDQLNTIESRIETDRENAKIYDGLKEEPINPKKTTETPNYEDDMNKMFGDEEGDLEKVLENKETWEDLLDKRFDELNVPVKDKEKFKANTKKLLKRQNRLEEDFFRYFDDMTDDEFELYCKNLEEKLNKKIKDNKIPNFYRQYMDKLKNALKMKNKSDMEVIIRTMFGWSPRALTICVGYNAFNYYRQLHKVPSEEVMNTILEKGWGRKLGGSIVQDSVGCVLAATAPGLFLPYEFTQWLWGKDVYQNTLEDFGEFVDDELDDSQYDLESFAQDGDGYYVLEKDSKTGNFTVKTYFDYDNKNKTFNKRSSSSNETKTTPKYDNSPAGYKKFIEDNNKTYGNAGGYVHQSGTPLYKDGTGKWQAGEYKDGTFVIPDLK